MKVLDVNTLSNIIIAIASFIAIVISIIAYWNSSRTALKINSKEYQINEDLKYSLLQVIASVRSIDAKAAVALDILQNPKSSNYKPDFSLELDIITKLQSSPGYLLFLNSIKDAKERTVIESVFRNISMKLLFFDYSSLRYATHMLLRHIKGNINSELIGNVETASKMQELCDMEGVFTNFDYDKLLKVQTEVDHFIKYLEEQGIKNPDIEFSDTGINPKMYRNEYEEFKKTYKV